MSNVTKSGISVVLPKGQRLQDAPLEPQPAQPGFRGQPTEPSLFETIGPSGSLKPYNEIAGNLQGKDSQFAKTLSESGLRFYFQGGATFGLNFADTPYSSGKTPLYTARLRHGTQVDPTRINLDRASTFSTIHLDNSGISEVGGTIKALEDTLPILGALEKATFESGGRHVFVSVRCAEKAAPAASQWSPLSQQGYQALGVDQGQGYTVHHFQKDLPGGNAVATLTNLIDASAPPPINASLAKAFLADLSNHLRASGDLTSTYTLGKILDGDMLQLTWNGPPNLPREVWLSDRGEVRNQGQQSTPPSRHLEVSAELRHADPAAISRQEDNIRTKLLPAALRAAEAAGAVEAYATLRYEITGSNPRPGSTPQADLSQVADPSKWPGWEVTFVKSYPTTAVLHLKRVV